MEKTEGISSRWLPSQAFLIWSRRLKYSGDFLQSVSRSKETTAPFSLCLPPVSRIRVISGTSLSLCKLHRKIHTNRSANRSAALRFNANKEITANRAAFFMQGSVRGQERQAGELSMEKDSLPSCLARDRV